MTGEPLNNDNINIPKVDFGFSQLVSSINEKDAKDVNREGGGGGGGVVNGTTATNGRDGSAKEPALLIDLDGDGMQEVNGTTSPTPNDPKVIVILIISLDRRYYRYFLFLASRLNWICSA